MKLGLTEFSDRLVMEKERKKEVRNDSKVFVQLRGWSCYYLMEKTQQVGSCCWGRSDQEFGLGHVKFK